jgi:hypothetical protein
MMDVDEEQDDIIGATSSAKKERKILPNPAGTQDIIDLDVLTSCHDSRDLSKIDPHADSLWPMELRTPGKYRPKFLLPWELSLRPVRIGRGGASAEELQKVALRNKFVVLGAVSSSSLSHATRNKHSSFAEFIQDVDYERPPDPEDVVAKTDPLIPTKRKYTKRKKPDGDSENNQETKAMKPPKPKKVKQPKPKQPKKQPAVPKKKRKVGRPRKHPKYQRHTFSGPDSDKDEQPKTPFRRTSKNSSKGALPPAAADINEDMSSGEVVDPRVQLTPEEKSERLERSRMRAAEKACGSFFRKSGLLDGGFAWQFEALRPACQATNCKATPTYGALGQEELWCQKHASKDLIRRPNKVCREEDCDKLALFGTAVRSRSWCAEHRRMGDVDLTDPAVAIPNKTKLMCTGSADSDCKTKAHYGFWGEPVSKCIKHRIPEMVATSERHCSVRNCDELASHGRIASARNKCLEHAEPQDKDFRIAKATVKTAARKCTTHKCKVFPHYGWWGRKGEVCGHHKEPGMVSFPLKKCRAEGCRNLSSHGRSASNRKWCQEHQQPGEDNDYSVADWHLKPKVGGHKYTRRSVVPSTSSSAKKSDDEEDLGYHGDMNVDGDESSSESDNDVFDALHAPTHARGLDDASAAGLLMGFM